MLDSIYHMASNYLKLDFWLDNVQILPSFTQRYNGRHYVAYTIYKQQLFINFIAWRYIIPKRDVM